MVLADTRLVTVYDLSTGRRLGQCDLGANLKHTGFLPPAEAPDAAVRYTLTVAGGRIYVRLGSRALADPRALPKEDKGENEDVAEARGDSFLVCLGLEPDQRGILPCHWQVKARPLDTDPPTFFEGSPAVRDGRVWVARTRFTDANATTALECYDAETGAPRWQQDVCEVREAHEGRPRYRHHLLTLAGPNVVYCSHSGAVVALDGLTGKRAWAVRYARRGERTADGALSPRDLAPCVAAEGRLFVAPADADRIFCLDGDSGRLLWESKPIEVKHLLGVSHNKLIFTTGSWPRGLRAVDAATGRDLRGWVQPDDGGRELPAVGRGLLAGDYIFWPTRYGLSVLGLEDGQPAVSLFVPPDNAIKGNLAVGGGCLVVATPKELLGYVPEGRLLEQRRTEAADRPDSALAQYRLALALADTGKDADALAALAAADRLTRPDEVCDGRPLSECVRGQRWEVLLHRAGQAATRQRWDDAVADLARAAEPSQPAARRVRALVRLAELWEKAGQPRKAVAAWQALLAEETLRSLCVPADNGMTVPVAAQATQRIGALVEVHGAAVYDRFESQARERLAAAPKAEKAKAVEQLAEEFPTAAATRTALREDALAPALARWRLRAARTEDERAAALAALARAYEREKSWDCARATWLRLRREAGVQTLAVLDAARPVADFVTEQLKKPEYRIGGRTSPDLPLPLNRAWQVSLTRESLLPGEPMADADFFYLGRAGHTLVCRAASDGRQCWTRDLDGPLTWANRWAEVTVAAGPRAAWGLRLSDGSLLWRLDSDSLSVAGEEPLTGFRLVSGCLFFVQGQRRLLALDVETGTVLWTHAAGGEGFSPWFHVGLERVVIQTAAGRCRVLDSLNGRCVADYAAGNGPWPRSPLPLDERRLVVVPDLRHVALLDLTSGKEVWRHALGRDSSLTGEAPQLLGDGDRLLVRIPRNHGDELIRLDTTTGVPRWPRSVLLTEDNVDLARSALGTEAAYLVAGNLLRAVSLADCAPLWDCPLTGATGRWRVRRTERCILAYPEQAQPEVEITSTLARYQVAVYPAPSQLPLTAALPVVLAVRRQADAPSRFPVLLCDPRDGQLIQRFNFVSRGPDARLRVQPHGVLVGLADAVWELR